MIREEAVERYLVLWRMFEFIIPVEEIQDAADRAWWAMSEEEIEEVRRRLEIECRK